MYNEEEKDDQNPTFQAINIQRQHILAVLLRMIQKLELSMCLEDVLNVLEHKEYKINRTTLTHLKSMLHRHSKTKDSTPKIPSTIRQTASYNTVHSIQLINETLIPTLHHRADTRAVVKSQLKAKPEKMKDFVVAIHGLFKYIEEMINKTETEESKYRKNISKTWVRNKKYKENLIEMQNIYIIKTKDFVAVLNDKKDEKEKYMRYIQELNEKSLYDWESIILKTENEMKQHQRISEENRDKLFEEAQTVTKDYNTLLQSDLDREKKLRIKRFKVESILAQLLAKYDTDIGDLQRDLEEVQDAYNDLQSNYQNLQRDFEEQSVRHTELMQEKQEEEQRIFNAKLYKIILNRSVRIIQRWWRKIYNKRHRKRKGKGKKGKKGKKR